MHPAELRGVKHRQLRRNVLHSVRKHHLQFHHVVLQLGQTPLQQHMAVIHDAHMVAHVLQLPEVVTGHQHRSAALRHIAHHQAPHLTAHHRVQTVHRLIQDQIIRHGGQSQPEGRLLLHTLGKPPDRPLFVQLKHFPQLFIPLRGEVWIEALVKPHHIPDARRIEIVPIIGNGGDLGLQRRVFPHILAAQPHGAAVLPENAGEVADDGGLARAVGPYQSIDGSGGHTEGRVIQGGKAVKGLDDVFHFDHCSYTSSMSAAASASVTPRYRSSFSSFFTSARSVSRLTASASAVPLTKLPFPATE